MRPLLLVIVLVLAGCGGVEQATTFATVGEELPTATPESYTIEGVFTLRDPGSILLFGAGPGARPDSCAGNGGYDDVEPGLQVVVRDGEGSTLGTGRLAYDHDAHEASRDVCPLVFGVPGLPRSDFYAVEVGRRGELVYSFDELEAAGWEVQATLGD